MFVRTLGARVAAGVGRRAAVRRAAGARRATATVGRAVDAKVTEADIVRALGGVG